METFKKVFDLIMEIPELGLSGSDSGSKGTETTKSNIDTNT